MKAVLALVLILAGCASRLSTPSTPDTPEVAACRTEARNDPQRRLLLQRHSTGNSVEIERMAADAEQAALDACLRRRSGRSEEGGVERIRL